RRGQPGRGPGAHRLDHRRRGVRARRPGGPRARLRAHRQDAEDAHGEDARRGGRRLLALVPGGPGAAPLRAARALRAEVHAVVELEELPLLVALAALLFAALAEWLHT